MPDLGAADGTTQTVYIGNLAFEATQDDLWRFLEARYGAVRSVRVMTDQQTHASRGYGFATFAAHRAAAEVCAGRQEGGRAGGQEGGRAGGPEPGCVVCRKVCRKGTCSTTRPGRLRARAAGGRGRPRCAAGVAAETIAPVGAPRAARSARGGGTRAAAPPLAAGALTRALATLHNATPVAARGLTRSRSASSVAWVRNGGGAIDA